MPDLYMGLDLGTLCGAALLTVDSSGTGMISTTWDCSIKTGHDSPALRFAKFEAQLSSFLALGVRKVFYELVRAHKGVKAAHIYGAFLARMQEVCDIYGVPYEGLGVGEVKKFATGKGNASKDEVQAAMRARGYSSKDDNESDAQAVVLTGWEKSP